MVCAATHVILHKRDTRAATGWLGLIWFAPILGVCFYWLFGINRIKRRAKKKYEKNESFDLPKLHSKVSTKQFKNIQRFANSGMSELCQLTDHVIRRPLTNGNKIDTLLNGDQAYPTMLSAINNAEISITLSTYIFSNDSWGNKFRIALRDAKQRGVAVRILVDAVGLRYSFPSIFRALQNDGIRVSKFMKTILPWRFRYTNLRNHRKIMVIDGITGFTGGMNISSGAFLGDKPASPTQDIHFKIQGSVVAEMQQVFAEDWAFSTGEKLEGTTWFPPLGDKGNVIARGISEGPDEDFDKLRFILMGAIATAQSSIQIVTPYFVPGDDIMTALQVSALRGIQVQIVLPETTNLNMVKWASDELLEGLIESGCMVFLTAPPFDHSKLMVVDGEWALIGSANWDSRSLSLNFEFNVECYDAAFALSIEKIISIKMQNATRVTLSDLIRKNRAIKLRNRFFRLFSPYL